jgi:rod shape-determining protein MreD
MDYRRRRLEERISHQIMLALLTLLTVIVQVNLLPMVLRASLNLVLVAVVAWTMVRDANTGAAVAFYGGLALDLLAGTPIGSHILPLLLVAGLTTVVIERFPAENWLLTLLLVGAGTPIYHLIVMIFSGGASNWLVWAAVVLPPALVVNLILALPEYLVLQWWNERRQFRR